MKDTVAWLMSFCQRPVTAHIFICHLARSRHLQQTEQALKVSIIKLFNVLLHWGIVEHR